MYECIESYKHRNTLFSWYLWASYRDLRRRDVCVRFCGVPSFHPCQINHNVTTNKQSFFHIQQ